MRSYWHSYADEYITAPRSSSADKTEASVASTIDALVAEHVAVREDVRGTDSLMVALVGTVVALLVGVVALFVQSPDPLAAVPWVWALIPSAPFAFGAYGLMKSTDVIIRSYYARVVERQLQSLLPDARLDDVKQPGDDGPAHDADEEQAADLSDTAERWGDRPLPHTLPLPSWAHIDVALNSPRHGGGLYRILFGSMWAIIDMVPIVIAALAFSRTEPVWVAVPASAVYLTIWVALNITAFRNVARGYGLWLRILKDLDQWELRRELLKPRSRNERRPREEPAFSWRYVLIPRPDDVIKWTYIIAGFVFGWLAAIARGLTPPSVPLAISVFLMFELVVYPARYILNDSRDWERDKKNPDPRRQARCPHYRHQRTAMFVSFCLRALITVCFTVWLALQPSTRDVAVYYSAACMALIIYSALYEKERDRTSRRTDSATVGTWIPLWLLVSVGGGLRLVLGLYLGLRQTWPDALLLALVVGWSIHFYVVTMSWALEASDRNREKPHLQELLSRALAKLPSGQPWLGQRTSWQQRLLHLRAGSREEANQRLTQVADVACCTSWPEADRCPCRIVPILMLPSWKPAPWDWSLMLTMIASPTLGVLLASGKDPATWLLVWWLIPLGAVVGWLLIRLMPIAGAIVAAAGALLMVGLTHLSIAAWGWAELTLVGASSLLPAALYIVFRRSTWAGMTRDMYRAGIQALVGVPLGAYAIGFGWFTLVRGGRHAEQGGATQEARNERGRPDARPS